MPDYAALAFSVMADPTRRSILRLLSEEDELPVTGIAEHFPEMTRAAVSSHLRVLRSADMVSERRSGQFRFYSLGPNRADDVVQFLHSVYQRDLDAFVQRAEDGTT